MDLNMDPPPPTLLFQFAQGDKSFSELDRLPYLRDQRWLLPLANASDADVNGVGTRHHWWVPRARTLEAGETPREKP